MFVLCFGIKIFKKRRSWGSFIHINELASIRAKVNEGGFDKIVSKKGQTKYTPEFAKNDDRIPERRLQSSALENLPRRILETRRFTHRVKVLAPESGNRVFKWVDERIIEDDNLKN